MRRGASRVTQARRSAKPEHIEERYEYEHRGVPKAESERRAWGASRTSPAGTPAGTFGPLRCSRQDTTEGISAMLGTILLIVLILLLLGAWPAWPYSRDWGYYPSGGLGLVLVIVLVLVLMGRF